MSASAEMESVAYRAPDKRLSQEAFTAIGWILTLTTLILVVFRIVTRAKIVRQTGWDDVLVIVAWVLILVFVVTWQIKSPLLYWQYDVVSGRIPQTPDFLPSYATFVPFVAVWYLLYYGCVFLVKFSFLIFFRQLELDVRRRWFWWWVVLTINIAAAVTALGNFDYKCSSTDLNYILTECFTEYRVRYFSRTLYVNTALDVATDILILSIPITTLWNVQINWKRKFVLFSLFSATLLIMATAIIRVVLVQPDRKAKRNLCVDWLFFWSLVEMAVAVMVACVASFRQLFVGIRNKQLSSSSPHAHRIVKEFAPSQTSLKNNSSSLHRHSKSRSDSVFSPHLPQ